MQERYIAAADLGSSKIGLCVAKVVGEEVQILYYREFPSEGIRYSYVFNPKKASKSLSAAVSAAEEELGMKITQLVVGLPRYVVAQESGRATVNRPDPSEMIAEGEVELLKSNALESCPLEDANKEIFGAVAQYFSTDDMTGASEDDVIGTCSGKLEGHFKIFVGSRTASTNIDRALAETGIAPAIKMFTADSTARAVLTDDEMDNGVALVEVGGGVTSLSIYKGGLLRYFGSIPFGGKSITSDIRYECAFGEKLAENIKLAFGACQPDKLQSLSEKVLQINDEDTGSYEHLPVKYLSEIITSRCREIVDAVLWKIEESLYADKLRSGIVLAGGGSELAGLGNLIKDMSGYTVRIGFPRCQKICVEGCPEICETSAATALGMVLAVRDDEHLNCTANGKGTVKKREVPKIVQEDDSKEELFPDEEAGTERQEKKKKSKDQTSSITWHIAKNMKKVFDGSLGAMFDEMGKN